MRAAHFILYVQDQALSTRFYQKVLGRPPRLDVPGMSEFELVDGAILGLMPEQGAQSLLQIETRPATTRCELYLVLSDLHGALRRALEAGGTLLQPAESRDWGERVAYLRDPDGHVLALAEKLS
ncbi:MAG: VOC family protein [Vulcanimicrobiota bacterium]